MSDYFVFGDVDSRDYSDIHVFDKSVDNTPKRVYEVKNIAGRNGALYVDQGRYEDVEHSYGVVALTKSAGSNFINALVSQVGYHRLSDSFNEDEFYLAILTDAVEAKVSKSTRDVNTFDITFTRQPQRFLKSGETSVSVASGGTLTNPTLFESHPLLHLWGYGSIGIDGDQLSINNDQYGKILLVDKTTHETRGLSKYIYRNSDYPNPKVSLMNEGDTLTLVGGSFISVQLYGVPVVRFTNVSVSVGGGISASVPSGATQIKNISLTFPEYTFSFGTTKTETIPITITAAYTYEGAQRTATVTGDIRVVYNVGSFYQAVSITILNITNTKPDDFSVSPNADKNGTLQAIYGYSTKRPFAEDADFYFDLDIGEAYKIEDGQTVSVNNAVTIPAQLPVLKSGENTITYDDTITQFQVVPRWWEV